MDICLQVMLTPPTHSLPTPERESARMAVGDVIEVYSAQKAGAWNGSEYIPHNNPPRTPRLGFVFITGVPNIALDKIRSKLTVPYYDPLVVVNPNVLRNRLYGIRVSDIPVGVRQTMMNQKFVTFTWAQVKNFLRNKVADTLITDANIQSP